MCPSNVPPHTLSSYFRVVAFGDLMPGRRPIVTNFPRVDGSGPLWEERVDDATSQVYFYNTEDHSVFEQVQNSGFRRIDNCGSTSKREVLPLTSQLPGGKPSSWWDGREMKAGQVSCWEQRVDEITGEVHFHSTHDRSVFELAQHSGYRRADKAMPEGERWLLERCLPGSARMSEDHIFDKTEQLFDSSYELRSFRELKRSHHHSTMATTPSVVSNPANLRWAEARTRTIALRLRLETYERRLLKPIKWAVARHHCAGHRLAGTRVSAPFEPVYYERATGKSTCGSLPKDLERFERHAVNELNGHAFVTWNPRRMRFHDGAATCTADRGAAQPKSRNHFESAF